MVTLWYVVAPRNSYFEGDRVSLKVEVAGTKRVNGVDALLGLVQNLEAKREGDSLVIDDLLVPIALLLLGSNNLAGETQ